MLFISIGPARCRRHRRPFAVCSDPVGGPASREVTKNLIDDNKKEAPWPFQPKSIKHRDQFSFFFSFHKIKFVKDKSECVQKHLLNRHNGATFIDYFDGWRFLETPFVSSYNPSNGKTTEEWWPTFDQYGFSWNTFLYFSIQDMKRKWWKIKF